MTLLPNAVPEGQSIALGNAHRGFVGTIQNLTATARGARSAEDVETSLIEMGFIEGARVEVLHEGPIGRDPIAVRVDDVTVALRRIDAMAVRVSPIERTSRP